MKKILILFLFLLSRAHLNSEEKCNHKEAVKKIENAFFQLNRVVNYHRQATGFKYIAIDTYEVRELKIFSEKLKLKKSTCQFSYSGAFCEREKLQRLLKEYREFFEANKARVCFNYERKIFLKDKKKAR